MDKEGELPKEDLVEEGPLTQKLAPDIEVSGPPRGLLTEEEAAVVLRFIKHARKKAEKKALRKSLKDSQKKK